MHEKKSMTSEHLVRFAVTAFNKPNPEELLQGGLNGEHLSCDTFAELMMAEDTIDDAHDDNYNRRYSAIDCQQMAEHLNNWLCKTDAFQLCLSQRDEINVFDLLAETLWALLKQENSTVVCRYPELLNWRMLVRSLGEEFPVTAMYALMDRQRNIQRHSFGWNYVLPHNNHELNTRMKKGIAEHHYHVWGSTPYFQLSWIGLMNSLDDEGQFRSLRYLEERNRLRLKQGEPQDEWVIEWLRCGLIRLYLSARFRPEWQRRMENVLNEHFNADSSPSNKKSDRLLTQVRLLLVDRQQLLLAVPLLQSLISSFCSDKVDQLDYAALAASMDTVTREPLYECFVGERYFMYQVLRDIYRKPRNRSLTEYEHNLFHAYLLMKLNLRKKLVQVNNLLGFDNFQRIQDRKEIFLRDDRLLNWNKNFAIRETLLSKPHLRELEVRLSPGSTAEECNSRIHDLEASLREPDALFPTEQTEESFRELQKRCYYVFHFIKEKDPALKRINQKDYHQIPADVQEYRHDELRSKVKEQAYAIMEFRARYPEYAARVCGIDACSQEIGCRPEVFAPVFRVLGEHTIKYLQSDNTEVTLPRLRKTYHAGEDFLDLVDGLRAVDEAVRFLNMDCGDRIGHGIALGTPPSAWYRRKGSSISLPSQDYLDNLAWLYHTLHVNRKYTCPDREELKQSLNQEFMYYFEQIYQNHFDDAQMNLLVSNGETHYKNRKMDNQIARSYRQHPLYFDIDVYYRAWKLRGDDPELYRSGYCSPPENTLDEWSAQAVNRQSISWQEYRYCPECSLLNYLYHYDPNIKGAGAQPVSLTVSSAYIRAAEFAQLVLREKLAQKGISIECNPSSNVLIGNFRTYEEHPILSFYSRPLPLTPEEENVCSQLPVSVNTDDKGVFYTDLDNEYALLALSVENLGEPEARRRFHRSDVYDWLDNIREMGLRQSFAEGNGSFSADSPIGM